MPVKMLEDVKNNSRPPVLGHISTGTTNERNLPTQVDHFVLPENLKAFYAKRGLPTEPKVIEGVFLVYDDIDQEYFTQYRKTIKFYGKSKLVCWGDDVSGKATRIELVKQGNETREVKKEVACLGPESTDAFCDKCKDAPVGQLSIIVPDFEEYGIFIVQSKSIKTHFAMSRCLWGIKNAGIDTLRYIPMKIEVIPFTATFEGKKSTRYYINMTPMISNRQMLELSQHRNPTVAAIEGSTAPTGVVVEAEEPQYVEALCAEESEVCTDAEVVTGEVVDDEAPAPSDEEDPFGAGEEHPNAPLTIDKNHAKLLEKMRKDAGISDAQWTKVLQKYCGVSALKDAPQKIGANADVVTFDYLKNAIEQYSAKKAAAADAAQEKLETCCGCGTSCKVYEMIVSDNGPICKDCASLAESMGQ